MLAACVRRRSYDANCGGLCICNDWRCISACSRAISGSCAGEGWECCFTGARIASGVKAVRAHDDAVMELSVLAALSLRMAGECERAAWKAAPSLGGRQGDLHHSLSHSVLLHAICLHFAGLPCPATHGLSLKAATQESG